MNALQWQRLSKAVNDAQQLSENERVAFVKRAFKDDTVIRELALKMLEKMDAQETNIADRVAMQLSPLLSTPKLSEGDQVAGYRIQRKLGQGGMGIVYLGERISEHYEMSAAIKVVSPDHFLHEGASTDLSELQFLANLTHPNIARLIDGGIHPDVGLYLITEFVEGQTLMTYLEQHHLSVSQRLQLFLSLCDAVHHAHSRLTIHCDIKPSNIMIDNEGIPKLLDFGISATTSVGKDGAQKRAYTPDYASPEQIMNSALSTASDVYSMGLVLHEMLTGGKAFPDATSRDAKALLEQREQLADELVQIDKELSAIIKKASAFLVDNRYKDISSLRRDIEHYLQNLPVSPLSDSRYYKAYKFFQRNHYAVLLAGILLTTVIAFLVFSRIQSSALRVERDRLAIEREAKSASTNFLASTLGQLDAVTPSPDLLPVTTGFLISLAAKAENELADVPSAHAEILRIVGDALHTFGEFDAAEKMVSQSLTMSLENLDMDSLDLASTYLVLANIIATKGDYATADGYFDKAKELLKETEQRKTIQHARLETALGERARILGDMATAERHLDNAVSILRSVRGNRNPETASAMDNLAYLYLFRGDAELSIPIFTEAREITSDTLGRTHANYGRQTSHLATAYRDIGDLDNAAKYFYDAIETLETALGKHQVFVINTRVEYARLEQLRGNLDNAFSEFSSAVDSAAITFGKNHYQYGIQLLGQANILYQMQRIEEADRLYDTALSTLVATLPENNVFIGAAQVGLAMTALDTERHAVASEHLSSAISIFEKGIGRDHWYYHLAQCLNALVFELNGDETKAAAIIDSHFLSLLEQRHEQDFRVQRIRRSALSIGIEK